MCCWARNLLSTDVHSSNRLVQSLILKDLKINLLWRSVTCVNYYHLLRRMCVRRLIHSAPSTSVSSASTDSTDLRWKISGEKLQKFPKSWIWICCTGNSLLLLFSCSVVHDSTTPWTAARQASLSFTVSQSLLRLMSIESVIPSNHLILYQPLLLPPSVFPSISLSNESALRIRWLKDWSFCFSLSPSNEYSELISLRADWFDLLAVQGTVESLLQHHQFEGSHSYMTTGKTIALATLLHST